MHTNIYIYIFSIPSAGSHHKLKVVLSKSGHWFIFVYYHLTYVEILSCSALVEIHNSLKQDLTLKYLVKCVEEMPVHCGCLVARLFLILEPLLMFRSFPS